MTGFARHALEVEGQSLVWELRSVNHRYLDLRLQIPEALRELEPELRTAFQQAVARGKVDAQLRVEAARADAQVAFDAGRAKALIDAIGEIDHMMVNGARVSPLEILGWPGVLEPPGSPDAEILRDAVLQGLRAAIADLNAMRTAEGEGLCQLLEQRLEALVAQVAQIRERRPAIVHEQRERLQARIAELDLILDPQRLEQEVALLAQRLDVDEELDRLDGHVAAMREILERDEPVGRRLDFLMQEFNREANTLGSKSHDLDTTRAAMEMKVLIEQMREQVQNVE
ncbi:Protein YicC [Thioalkalivibrio nitratireducens DSM 14787]|uniref:Protein YicC n=2 Tax=Thioalkalivibrio nitratireducens TaxID=186931 RepID=L0E061_THIND|nr:Protein YicC [Thioalkalivibrio nitratireducens DSM 14787]